MVVKRKGGREEGRKGGRKEGRKAGEKTHLSICVMFSFESFRNIRRNIKRREY
jgi:hypothetical protein